MTLITNLKLENEFSNLEDHIKNLKISNNSMAFQKIIVESMKLLSLISRKVGNDNNLFGKNVPTELLIYMISFLPIEYGAICRSVCMNWLKSLKSNVSKKILPLIPKDVCYLESVKINFEARIITKIMNDIYIVNSPNICKINIDDFTINNNEVISFVTNSIASNDNYICIEEKLGIINIYSLKMEFINSIKIEGLCFGLAIDNNNNICAATYNRFYVCNLQGKIINSWELDYHGIGCRSRKIAFYKNEIYMADNTFNCVRVFSYDGKLIRSLGHIGSGHAQFVNPWGIAVCRDIVYVVDSGNNRIQALTCEGKYIFEYKQKYIIDLSDIMIVNDYIYTSDWLGTNFTKSKIIYD